MAKGSVRKKGKKWYYRFYVENDSGRKIQREFAGTESKAETEALMRKAMRTYEETRLLQTPGNATVAELLNRWLEEEVKPGTLSNGTLMAYEGTIRRIQQFPIGKRKLKQLTPDHLQSFFDQLTFGEIPENTYCMNRGKPISRGYLLQFSAIMHGAFRFAVYPGRMLPYNLMQYVKVRKKREVLSLFPEDGETEQSPSTISEQQFSDLTEDLRKRSNAALLPVQIAYYTGLRLGEVCALAWQDIDLKEHAIMVRRSIRYNSMRHQMEMGPAKRNKVRVVYYGDILSGILHTVRDEQNRRSFDENRRYLNYYKKAEERDRVYYDVFRFPREQIVSSEYHRIDFVCLRPCGSLEAPGTVSIACRKAANRISGMEGFHFHQLRHTYTSNLLKQGASPKDVQELLGHESIRTTMDIYAHADREEKRNCSRLLDQLRTNVPQASSDAVCQGKNKGNETQKQDSTELS